MAFHLHLCTAYIYISTRPATGLKTCILQHLSSSLSLYCWIPGSSPYVAVPVSCPFFRSSNWVYSSSRKLRSFRLQPLVDKTVGTGHKLLTNKSRNTFFKSTFFVRLSPSVHNRKKTWTVQGDPKSTRPDSSPHQRSLLFVVHQVKAENCFDGRGNSVCLFYSCSMKALMANCSKREASA